MKIAVLVARILLGLMFVIFGLNGFLNFLHMPMPTGLAGQYMGALFTSHYLVFVFLVQLVGGLLLLAGQFVPLALVLVGPVIVNILLFHITMAPAGLPPALLATILWLVIFFGHREAFAGIFARRA
jgi:putative oxidoreductase